MYIVYTAIPVSILRKSISGRHVDLRRMLAGMFVIYVASLAVSQVFCLFGRVTSNYNTFNTTVDSHYLEVQGTL